MALGQYSTDYPRSVYHRVFFSKVFRFLRFSNPGVVGSFFYTSYYLKKQTFPQWSHCQNKYFFEKKKNSSTNLLFGMTVYPFIRSRGRKLSYPADITSAERNQHPPELALLCQTVHIRPFGEGDICTCLVRMLHFISQYVPASEPKVTSSFLSVLFP